MSFISQNWPLKCKRFWFFFLNKNLSDRSDRHTHERCNIFGVIFCLGIKRGILKISLWLKRFTSLNRHSKKLNNIKIDKNFGRKKERKKTAYVWETPLYSLMVTHFANEFVCWCFWSHFFWSSLVKKMLAWRHQRRITGMYSNHEEVLIDQSDE